MTEEQPSRLERIEKILETMIANTEASQQRGVRTQVLEDLKVEASIQEELKKIATAHTELLTPPDVEIKKPGARITADDSDDKLINVLGYHAVHEIANYIARKLKSEHKKNQPGKVILLDKLSFGRDDLPKIQIETRIKQLQALVTQQTVYNSNFADKYGERHMETPDQAVKPPELSGLTPEEVATLLASPLPNWSGMELMSPSFGAMPGVFGNLPLAAAIGAFPAVFNTISGVINAVRPTTTIKSAGFDLNNEALIISLAGALERDADGNRKEDNPWQVEIVDFNRITKFDTLNAVEALISARIDLEQSNANAQGAVSSLDPKNNKAALEEAGKLKAASETLSKTVNDFLTAITTKTNDEAPLLVQAVVREQLDPNAWLLYVNILTSGGKIMIQEAILKRDKLVMLAGATVSYVIAKKDGDVLTADVVNSLFSLTYHLHSGKATVNVIEPKDN